MAPYRPGSRLPPARLEHLRKASARIRGERGGSPVRDADQRITLPYYGLTAAASAIVAQLVPAAEIHWSCP
jgi:hypothetical protein